MYVPPEFKVAKTLDLIPNGSNIAVAKENRLQYIQLVSHYRLSKQIKLQSEAFFEGLWEMKDTKWLPWVLAFLVSISRSEPSVRSMFSQQEVQKLAH